MVKNQIFQFSLQAPDNGKRAFNYEFRETASVKVTDHREVEGLKSYKFRQRGQQDMEHQSGVISTQAAGVTETLQEDYLFGFDSLGLGLGLWTGIWTRACQ